MHGCAPGAGGPEGERYGNYKHGLYTKKTRMRLRAIRDLTRAVKDLTRKLRGGVRSGNSSRQVRADLAKNNCNLQELMHFASAIRSRY